MGSLSANPFFYRRRIPPSPKHQVQPLTLHATQSPFWKRIAAGLPPFGPLIVCKVGKVYSPLVVAVGMRDELVGRAPSPYLDHALPPESRVHRTTAIPAATALLT